ARKAADRRLVLALVHNFQFARSVRRARRQLEEGRWGKITALHGFQLSSPGRRLPHWYEQLPLGLFYDESPHLLYLLRAFGGPVTVQRASQIPSTRGAVTPAVLNVELEIGATSVSDGPPSLTLPARTNIPATLFMNFEAPI